MVYFSSEMVVYFSSEIYRKKHSVNINYWEEKKTDVALACYMIRDVVLNKCDVSILF